MPRKADPAGIVEQVLASPKYRHLDETLVRRVAGEAAGRFRDHSEAVRYARRKLHQAFGAFLTGEPAAAVRGCVDAIARGAEVRGACLTAMRAHASTAERIAWLEPFYAQVSAWSGPVSSVVDLACGLNPLALPWLPLEPRARYWCCDIDRDLVAALGGLSTVFPVQVQAQTCDLLAAPSLPAADLALVLKTLTTLEQQRAGAAAAVLATLDAPHVVLSLPRRSLGARRSYVDDPLATIGKAAGSRYRLAGQAEFGDELLCHLVPA
jgi:Ribosomal RNA methyltransferase (FmrO)